MISLFIDVDNLYRSIGRKFQKRLDYQAYLNFIELKFNECLGIKMAYGSQNPRDAKSFINLLKALGFTTRFNENVDWNVPITLGVMNVLDKVDIVVIGSNHKNLGPLVENLQSQGIRTFICASNIHPYLKNLSEYHEIDEKLLLISNDHETVETNE